MNKRPRNSISLRNNSYNNIFSWIKFVLSFFWNNWVSSKKLEINFMRSMKAGLVDNLLPKFCYGPQLKLFENWVKTIYTYIIMVYHLYWRSQS